jgi:hypothetical protein
MLDVAGPRPFASNLQLNKNFRAPKHFSLLGNNMCGDGQLIMHLRSAIFTLELTVMAENSISTQSLRNLIRPFSNGCGSVVDGGTEIYNANVGYRGKY